jgi:ABC-2 type transport system permease protein
MNPTTTPSAPPVAPDPWHAFGGIWRLTYLRFRAPGQWRPLLIVLAVLTLLAGAIVRDGRAKLYFSLASGFYLTVLVPFMAFLSGGGAIRDELKSGSVDYVLTRPVRRPVFVIFKFLSHLACTQVLFLLGLGVMLGVAGFRHIPGVWPMLPWLLLGQVIIVTAFSAFGFFCGVLTSRYIIIGLFYGAVIEAGVGNIPIQLNRLSLTHQVKAMLEPLLPFGPAVIVPGPGALVTVGFFLAYTVVMLALAAAIFSFQELAGAKPGEG